MKNRDFERLRQLVAEICDLRAAAALLDWDLQVGLPPGAAAERTLQSGTLAGVIHRRSTSPAIGRLLERLERESFEPDSFEAAFLRRVARDYRRRTRVPGRLVAAISSAAGNAYNAWLRARESADFRLLAPDLERMVELKNEYASLFPEFDSPYDALLDDYEEGAVSAELDRVFDTLRVAQTALVREIAARPQVEDSFLSGEFGASAQLSFSRMAVRRLGYDFNRGRLDLTEHPFTTSFGLSDVRITTRVVRTLPLSCLLSAVHECGHAIYEQGIDPSFDRSLLADGASLGFHESQSRLYENQVARSLPFWKFFFPKLRKRFPRQLGGVSVEAFYRAVNKVEPSLIRTEADEATYNLHIMLRYELEKELFAGRLRVAELPEAWNCRMRDYLGIVPPDDRSGVLQDIHWALGDFGYFPTYALGNLIGAMVWKQLRSECPGIDDEIAAGRFAPLRAWLREHLHRYGASLPPAELLERICGRRTVDAGGYVEYLREKFCAVYDL